jgi:hypothetical protein
MSTHSEAIANLSIEEWMLDVLRAKGPQLLNELAGCLPETTWAQLLLAIDRLGRVGKITLLQTAHGDYVISPC